MDKVNDSSTFSDNNWEEVCEKSDAKIKEWIDYQLSSGLNTEKAMEFHKGLVYVSLLKY